MERTDALAAGFVPVHDHSGFAECQGCEWAAAEEIADAEEAFLVASVAVWREIDRVSAEGPYRGIEGTEEGVRLRKVEKAAWERYRNLLDERGLLSPRRGQEGDT